MSGFIISQGRQMPSYIFDECSQAALTSVTDTIHFIVKQRQEMS